MYRFRHYSVSEFNKHFFVFESNLIKLYKEFNIVHNVYCCSNVASGQTSVIRIDISIQQRHLCSRIWRRYN